MHSHETLAHPPLSPAITSDGGLGFKTIVGDFTPADELLGLIARRIRIAAGHLGLGRDELQRIFSRHTVFEGKTAAVPGSPPEGFLIVETHHVIQGMVGKGALKIVYPQDLLGKAEAFRDAGDGGASRPGHRPHDPHWPRAAPRVASARSPFLLDKPAACRRLAASRRRCGARVRVT